MSEFKTFNTLHDFYSAVGIEIEAADDITIHTVQSLHKKIPFHSPLTRANYFTIVIVKQGKGSYSLNSKSFLVRDQTIYFTNPGHIKGFEILKPPEAFLITFSEKFLKQSIHEAVFTEFPFLLSYSPPPYYSEESDFEKFWETGRAIFREYKGDAKYRTKLLGSLVSVLLYYIKETIEGHSGTEYELSPNHQIAVQFRKNLESIFRNFHNEPPNQRPKVSDFAKMQLLHPNYFSTVIKNATGKPAIWWINEKIIDESKALLSRPDISVKEVLNYFGFHEAGHFSKFFKKHTGLTPSTYKKQASQ